jgi:hypothetical protein
MFRVALCLAPLPLLAALACDHPCPFTGECDGSVLETCSPGSGLVGASYSTQDCSQSFASCVEPDAGQAFCAANPCDTTFLARCLGTTLFFCDFSSGSGFVNSADCTQDFDAFGDPGTCVDNGNGNANCVP